MERRVAEAQGEFSTKSKRRHLLSVMENNYVCWLCLIPLLYYSGIENLRDQMRKLKSKKAEGKERSHSQRSAVVKRMTKLQE